MFFCQLQGALSSNFYCINVITDGIEQKDMTFNNNLLFFPPFSSCLNKRGKKKIRMNSKNRDQTSCLSARSMDWMGMGYNVASVFYAIMPNKNKYWIHSTKILLLPPKYEIIMVHQIIHFSNVAIAILDFSLLLLVKLSILILFALFWWLSL